MKQILSLLRESEHSGELVLRERAELVHMDRLSNKNREALNSLKRQPDTDSVYLCTGNMFMKHRVSHAKEIIQKDQKEIEENVKKFREDIQKNVEQIHVIENKGDRFSAAFNLNPLSNEEMKGFGVMLDQIKKIQL